MIYFVIKESTQSQHLMTRILNNGLKRHWRRTPAANISYLSSAAAVVFGVHLSAQAVFQLDRKSPAIRSCV